MGSVSLVRYGVSDVCLEQSDVEDALLWLEQEVEGLTQKSVRLGKKDSALFASELHALRSTCLAALETARCGAFMASERAEIIRKAQSAFMQGWEQLESTFARFETAQARQQETARSALHTLRQVGLGTVSGVKSGCQDVADAIRHPITNIVDPLASLAGDSVFAALGDQKSQEAIRLRADGLASGCQNIKRVAQQGSAFERSELAAHAAVTALLPGTVIKGARAVAGVSKVAQLSSKAFVPGSGASHLLQEASFHSGRFLFGVSSEGRLRLADSILVKPLHEGNVARITAAHGDLFTTGELVQYGQGMIEKGVVHVYEGTSRRQFTLQPGPFLPQALRDSLRTRPISNIEVISDAFHVESFSGLATRPIPEIAATASAARLFLNTQEEHASKSSQ